MKDLAHHLLREWRTVCAWNFVTLAVVPVVAIVVARWVLWGVIVAVSVNGDY